MLPRARWLPLLVVFLCVSVVWAAGGGTVSKCYEWSDHYPAPKDQQNCPTQSIGCYWIRPQVGDHDDLNEKAAQIVAGGCWTGVPKEVTTTGDLYKVLNEGESAVKATLDFLPARCSFEEGVMDTCTETKLQATITGLNTRTLTVLLCCCSTDGCNSDQPSGIGQRYMPGKSMERPQLRCEKQFCGQPDDEGLCVHRLDDSDKAVFECVTAQAKGDLGQSWEWCNEKEHVGWHPAKLFTNTMCRYDIKQERRVCCCAGPSCVHSDLENVPSTITTTPAPTSGSCPTGTSDSVAGSSSTQPAAVQTAGIVESNETSACQSSAPLAVTIAGFAIAGVLLLIVIALVVLLLRCRHANRVKVLPKPSPEAGLPPVAAPVNPSAATKDPLAATPQVAPTPDVSKASPSAVTEEKPVSPQADSASQSLRSDPMNAHSDNGPAPDYSESTEGSRADGAAVRVPKDSGHKQMNTA